MPRKTIHNKSKKTNKHKPRKTMKKMHGGNCGCGCQQRSFFGGSTLVNGTVFGGIKGPISGAAEVSKLSPSIIKGGSPFGSPSFDGSLGVRNYYALNQYKPDVQHMQESSRLNPNMVGGTPAVIGGTPAVIGGRSWRRSSKKNRKQKKMKGGIQFSTIRSFVDPIYNSASNAVSSVGNLSGTLLQSNVLNGVITNNYNPTQTNPVIKQYV